MGNSIIYSFPYLAVMLMIGVLGILSERQKDREISHRYTLLGIAIFFLFFGFRGLVGHDWTVYYPEFEDMSLYRLMNYDYTNVKIHEPGWMLFVIACKVVWDNYFFMVAVLTLIEVILLVRFLSRYTYNVLLSIVLLMTFEGCSIICDNLRNFPAILLFLNALPYLENRKPLPYFGICLLATSLHFSSLLYFPLYFFWHKDLNKWVFATLILLCNVLFVANVPIVLSMVKLFHIGGDFLTTKLEVYSEMQGHRGLGLGFIERLMTAGLIFCYYDKLKTVNPSIRIFIHAYAAYMVMLTFFSEFDEIAKRMSMLFLFSYWIIWPSLIKCYTLKSNRMLFSAFVGLYCMLHLTLTVNQPVEEYDTVLLGNAKSYTERKYIFEKTYEVEDIQKKK